MQKLLRTISQLFEWLFCCLVAVSKHAVLSNTKNCISNGFQNYMLFVVNDVVMPWSAVRRCLLFLLFFQLERRRRGGGGDGALASGYNILAAAHYRPKQCAVSLLFLLFGLFLGLLKFCRVSSLLCIIKYSLSYIRM